MSIAAMTTTTAINPASANIGPRRRPTARPTHQTTAHRIRALQEDNSYLMLAFESSDAAELAKRQTEQAHDERQARRELIAACQQELDELRRHYQTVQGDLALLELSFDELAYEASG